jgi:hypothetical protein
MNSSEPLLEFFDKQLKRADTGWSVGSFGVSVAN